MKIIEDYRFGYIKISGKEYRNDVKIIGDEVIDKWWRKQGHRVFVEDILDILEHGVDIVILGQGEPGMMKADNSLKKYLIEKNIKLIEKPTRDAIIEFNTFIRQNKRVGAGFHLTC